MKENKKSMKKCLVWLVSEDEVLVNDIALEGKVMKINDVTLESENVLGLIKSIEKNWNIVCSKDDLRYITSLTNEGEECKCYVLKMRMNLELKEVVLSNYTCKFCNYNSLSEKAIKCKYPEIIQEGLKSIKEFI